MCSKIAVMLERFSRITLRQSTALVVFETTQNWDCSQDNQLFICRSIYQQCNNH